MLSSQTEEKVLDVYNWIIKLKEFDIEYKQKHNQDYKHQDYKRTDEYKEFIFAKIKKVYPYNILLENSEYYTGSADNAAEDLKRIYKNNIDIAANKLKLNDKLKSPKPDDKIRIMTWNVRYWTQINNSPSISSITRTIDELSPDILCLQEVTVGHNKYYEKNINIGAELPNYELVSMCNNVPSWFSNIYGNSLFIKKSIIDNILNINLDSGLARILCDYNHKKCFFNQYAKTYNYPKPIDNVIESNKINIFREETRCFVKIAFGTFDIYCTHLDAYDKTNRRLQLDELNKTITRKSIILGDFNIVDTELYESADQLMSNYENVQKEWNYVKNFIPNGLKNGNYDIKYIRDELKWIDAFDMSKLMAFEKFSIFNMVTMRESDEYELLMKNTNSFEAFKKFLLDEERDTFDISYLHNILARIFVTMTKPNFTTWTNTVVDYIFFTKHWIADGTPNIEIIPYMHFNDFSDHIPIIIDFHDANVKLIEQLEKYVPSTSNPLYDLKTFKMTFMASNENDTIYLYNTQPLSTYDWYCEKKIITPFRSYKDPFTIGNYNMNLGANGLYFGSFKFVIKKYREGMQESMLRMHDIYDKNHILLNSGLLFKFKLINNDPLLFSTHKKPSTITKIDLDYATLDKEYDILFDTQMNVGKVTERGFNKINGTHNITELVSTYILVHYTDNTKLNVQVELKYVQESEKVKNIIRNKLPSGIENNLLDFYYYCFLSAIDFINWQQNEKINNNRYICKFGKNEAYINIDDIIEDAFTYDESEQLLMYDINNHFNFLDKKRHNGGYYAQYNQNKINYKKLFTR